MTVVRWVGWALVGLVLVGGAGCTKRPNSTGAEVTPTTLPSSRPDIPRVLDASAYRERPCDLLTDLDATRVGIHSPGIPRQKPESADCERRSSSGPNGSSHVTVSYHYATDLLGRIYEGRTNWPIEDGVEPFTVDDQPAIRTTRGTETSCRVAVALADTQGIEISATSTRIDACIRATDAARLVVGNLEAPTTTGSR